MVPRALPTGRNKRPTDRGALRCGVLALALGALCLGWGRELFAAGTLDWQTKEDKVSADIKSESLLHVLGKVARATGWQVYVEPGSTRPVSVRFKELPPGQALRLLVGDLNFALVPSTTAKSRLYVFHTSMERATQRVAAARMARIVPNELIVRLKPGVKIDELAKLLGAKVVGRVDSLNAYRLQFDNASATTAAATELAANPDVASVENNYVVDAPETMQGMPGSSAPLQLQLDPPSGKGHVIVGLVDTAVQPLGNGLDSFLLKQISEAGNAQLDPNNPSHGTAMAETMLRTLQLLENGHSSIQILPVDVYGPNTTSTTFDMAVGIQTAINQGANPINVSSGTPDDSAILSDLVTAANQKGIIIYASKGNDGGTDLIYPAAYPGVTAVSALDANGQPTSYSNKAPIPSVGAPGTSLIPFGDLMWMVQGTSPSAATTSMTAAVLADRGPLSAVAANAQLWLAPTPTTIPQK